MGTEGSERFLKYWQKYFGDIKHFNNTGQTETNTKIENTNTQIESSNAEKNTQIESSNADKYSNRKQKHDNNSIGEAELYTSPHILLLSLSKYSPGSNT